MQSFKFNKNHNFIIKACLAMEKQQWPFLLGRLGHRRNLTVMSMYRHFRTSRLVFQTMDWVPAYPTNTKKFIGSVIYLSKKHPLQDKY